MSLKTLVLGTLLAFGTNSNSPAAAPRASEMAGLEFSELFRAPVGQRGLTISEKAKTLNGQRVRMIGYIVRQEHSLPGMFLLAPIPVQVDQEHYGLADDLPPSTVFVSTPFRSNEPIPFKPGPVLVTGILRVGNREEADGRISIFRLEMDTPAKIQKGPLPPVSKTGQTRLGRHLLN
jgi:hypothetical protein